MTTDVGIHLRAFNWHLWDARQAKGLTQAQLAEDAGLTLARVQGFEQLRKWPTASEAGELATVLDEDEDTLFPEALQSRCKNVASSVRFRVPLTALPAPEEPDLLETPFDDGMKVALARSLTTLPVRMQRILRLRYGLDDGVTHTQREVSREFGVTPARIGSIEAKALRMMRHPSRSKKLQGYYDES